VSTSNQQGGQSQGIDVAAIERELTALWKQASDEETSGIIRASILNLLVYVPDAAPSNELDDVMIEVTAAHPSRAIVMLADREGPDAPINAQVTSRCTIPTATSKQVCCEQVTISAGGEYVDEIPSTVPQLLISDLPVYLWWRAVPLRVDRPMFRRLVDISDRVIIDSAEFNDPQGDLASLAVTMRDTPRWAAISDLNWARLTAWRALLASFYDVADYLPLLDRLDRVRIEYAPPSADTGAISARALLLAGWLASRLGWQPKPVPATRAARSTGFEMEASGRTITIEFLLTERDIEPGHLALVELTSAADSSASFKVRRSSDGARIETVTTRGEEKNIQRVLSYESLSEAALVGRELEILGHDRVYEQAILSAGELIKAVGDKE
jgi:glucose-6-phosphate dehydrogenase assembly protein OpcA